MSELPKSKVVPTFSNTAIVTVTYGERFHLIEEVVNAIIEFNFIKIIIIDNGSPIDNSIKICNLADQYKEKIEVIRLDENIGSAGGFRAGLTQACSCKNVEFIWLLDDDNKPFPDAFEKLQIAYKYMGVNPKYLLLSIRESRLEYWNAAVNGHKVGIIQGSFLGFHLANGIFKRMKLRKHADNVISYFSPLVRIDYAPYGGLLLHKEWLSIVSLPREKFFVYSDDHEFTMRVISNGGEIFLCAMSRIREIEASWETLTEVNVPVFMRDDTSENKIYYLIRNRTYIESKLYKMGMVYWVNLFVFLSYITLKSIFMGVKFKLITRRLSLIFRARRDGVLGHFIL